VEKGYVGPRNIEVGRRAKKSRRRTRPRTFVSSLTHLHVHCSIKQLSRSLQRSAFKTPFQVFNG
jgi:hypothetical protein